MMRIRGSVAERVAHKIGNHMREESFDLVIITQIMALSRIGHKREAMR